MNIHFILQGKGGVGKSFISVVFAQFLRDTGKKIACLDTDPNNASFLAYKNLPVKHIDILNDDKEIERDKFDELIEFIDSCSDVTDLVIDSGASCYIAFMNYLLQNEVFAMLKDMGHNVVIHTVVVGGQSCLDTLSALDILCNNLASEDLETYVWLNPFQGDIVVNGKHFSEMKAYQQHQDQINGYIELPPFRQEFEKDLRELTTAHLTFAEGIASDKYRLMQKQRFKTIQKRFYEVIGVHF